MRAKLYREHKYVSYALHELERAIARTDWQDDGAISYIQEEWHKVREMLEGHARHEEENVHALLARKGSTVHTEADHEHEHQDETMQDLELLLKGIASSKERIESGYQFYLAYRKFVGDNLLHLHEEETRLLPELQRVCSDAELRAIEHPTYEIMTVEQMVNMVQVLFPHMNYSDKCAFLDDIQEAQPQKFQEVWKRAPAFLSPEEMARFTVS